MPASVLPLSLEFLQEVKTCVLLQVLGQVVNLSRAAGKQEANAFESVSFPNRQIGQAQWLHGLRAITEAASAARLYHQDLDLGCAPEAGALS